MILTQRTNRERIKSMHLELKGWSILEFFSNWRRRLSGSKWNTKNCWLRRPSMRSNTWRTCKITKKWNKIYSVSNPQLLPSGNRWIEGRAWGRNHFRMSSFLWMLLRYIKLLNSPKLPKIRRKVCRWNDFLKQLIKLSHKNQRRRNIWWKRSLWRQVFQHQNSWLTISTISNKRMHNCLRKLIKNAIGYQRSKPKSQKCEYSEN